MEKHLLITVSDQHATNYGVQFVRHFFSNKANLKLTLYYATPKMAQMWAEELTLESESQAVDQAKEYETKGRKAVDQARKDLSKSGFKEEQILGGIKKGRVSKIIDIIQEAEEGLQDAVVLGRRGLTWLEQSFDHSVTSGLIDRRFTFPVWMCRRPDPDRRDVLVCLEGSDPCLRMADHVGFMLSDEPGHRITLLHIQTRDRTRQQAEAILQTGAEHVLANGFPRDRLEMRIVESARAGRAIREEAAKGQYAVVAAGRTGEGEGFLKKLFMGSVSTSLFKELKQEALWLCY